MRNEWHAREEWFVAHYGKNEEALQADLTEEHFDEVLDEWDQAAPDEDAAATAAAYSECPHSSCGF